MLFHEALQNGRLKEGKPPTEEEVEEIKKLLIPNKLDTYGLRFPERDAKKPADYLRISFKEEDEEFFTK
jgi:hypothetical protein